MEKSAVTSVCWVPRGKCNVRLDDDEEEPENNGAAGSSGANRSFTGLEEFGLDQYDDDGEPGMQFFTVLNSDGELAKEKDPYIQGDPNSDSDSDDDPEVKPDDQVFIATACEEDNCTLEMYVFEEEEGIMYVHHDIMLAAYPLCAEWISASTHGEGNFGAIGLIDHTIQIWDLDLLEPLEPIQLLGETKQARKAGKAKPRRKREPQEGVRAHEGPVLCLHSSPHNRSVLASGSADETLKVWDVSNGACVHTYKHHAGKVQCARWHPQEEAVLLSAAFDGRLALLDVRQPTQAAFVGLPGEAEAAVWSRHRPFECLASADNGGVACYDVRKVVAAAPDEEKVLYRLQAHEVACTIVQDTPVPNILVTAGLDGDAKIWNASGAAPSLLMCKSLQAGPIFACQSSAEAPGLLCFGAKCPVMWDLTSEQLLLDVFPALKVGEED